MYSECLDTKGSRYNEKIGTEIREIKEENMQMMHACPSLFKFPKGFVSVN